MQADYTIRIALDERGNTTDDVRVEGADALLGSASHCHVRLSPDKLAPEQLRFEAREGVLFAELRARQPLVTLDGQPFRSGRLPEDAVLRIGALDVRATLERRGGMAAGTSLARSRPLQLAAAVMLIGAVLLVFAARRQRSADIAPAAPALFTELTETCPEIAAEAARAAADEFARSAEAKRERAPFVAEDGLSAVGLYRRAARCSEQVGDLTQAASANRRADALQAQVERDYHLHQVRVYLAQRTKNSALLAREARVLTSYVRGRPSRYGDWLDQLQRQVEASIDNSKVKR